MTLPNTSGLFKIVGIMLLFFVLYRIIRFQINRLLPQKTKRKSVLPTIAPLDELTAKDRAFFERLRDVVYESERWKELLPELELNPKWTIQPAPPTESEVLRFKIWNKPHEAPAMVAFNPYCDNGNLVWKVFGEGTDSYDVPVEDTTQLRAVIAFVLQEVSPVKP